MKKFFTGLLGIIVTAFLTIIPVSANSAVKQWGSYETQGIFIMGDNPIEVSSEHLTFDFSKNDSFVTAEYNLYNSSDYDVECELVFPVGKINRYNIFDEYEGVYYYYPEVFLDDTKLNTSTRLVVNGGDIVTSIQNLEDTYYNSILAEENKYYKVTIDEASYNSSTKYNIRKNRFYYNNGDFSSSNVTYISLPKDDDSEISVTTERDEVVPFTIDEISFQDYIKFSNIQFYGEKLYECYSEVDIYNLSAKNILRHKDVYAAVDYKITIPAKGSVKNKVYTNLCPVIDRTYKPESYQFEYLLSPAKTFKSFKDLTITINTKDIYLLTNNLNIGRVHNPNNTFEVSYDELPSFNICLETCESYDQTQSSTETTLLITPLFIVLIALIIVVVLTVLKTIMKKEFKNSIAIIVENIILASLIVVDIIRWFSFYNVYEFIQTNTLLYIFGGILGLVVITRLVGALVINRKAFNKKTWIFDAIIMAIEAAFMVLCFVLPVYHPLVVYTIIVAVLLVIFNTIYLKIRRRFSLNLDNDESNNNTLEEKENKEE